MNSIAGFKFWDIKRWFLSEKFDVLIISETKLDSTFPASQFHVGGYCLCRADRKRYGRGLVVFVKNNIYCFTQLTEFQWLQANEWAGLTRPRLLLWDWKYRSLGFNRPPSTLTQQWTQALSSIFETASLLTDDVIFLADFTVKPGQAYPQDSIIRKLNPLVVSIDSSLLLARLMSREFTREAVRTFLLAQFPWIWYECLLRNLIHSKIFFLTRCREVFVNIQCSLRMQKCRFEFDTH